MMRPLFCFEFFYSLFAKFVILPVFYVLQKFLEDYGMIWVGETNEDAEEEANDTLLSARSAASWEPRSYILLFY